MSSSEPDNIRNRGSKVQTDEIETEKIEHRTPSDSTLSAKKDDVVRQNVNAKLANPLKGMSMDELREAGRDYAKSKDINDGEDVRAFELGAILAQKPERYDRLKGMAKEEEMQVLDKEFTHKWSQPWKMYLVIVLCSTCAAVQGMVC